MEFAVHRRRTNRTVVSDALSDIYNHDVSMYTDPPNGEISLMEFQELAIERVELLRIIEQAGLKGHRLYSEDWRNCIKEDIIKMAATKTGLKKYLRLINGFSTNSEQDCQARRADYISHFTLRTAYCRSEDLRRWFLNRELEWFRLRFTAQSPESIRKFLQINNLTYTSISLEERSELREQLLSSTPGVSVLESTEFYKVSFTDVLSLIKNRKVFLKSGIAYVPASELVTCIQTKFRSSLNESLHTFFRRLPNLDDERITGLLANLHTVYTGKSYAAPTRGATDSINPANVDAYSKKHFPLCMKQMHDSLRANHHLKHQARLTYGLFLKGIGLLYEDAMQFWKDEFTKKIDGNKFDKDYAYNIKHHYGKVGKMQSYSPYSCIKIVMNNVGPGEPHGCPFKLLDPSVIRQKAIEHGASTEGANDIKNLVTNRHYQVACTKYFECTHGTAPETTINHPNQYFEESMKLSRDKAEKKKN